MAINQGLTLPFSGSTHSYHLVRLYPIIYPHEYLMKSQFSMVKLWLNLVIPRHIPRTISYKVKLAPSSSRSASPGSKDEKGPPTRSIFRGEWNTMGRYWDNHHVQYNIYIFIIVYTVCVCLYIYKDDRGIGTWWLVGSMNWKWGYQRFKNGEYKLAIMGS